MVLDPCVKRTFYNIRFKTLNVRCTFCCVFGAESCKVRGQMYRPQTECLPDKMPLTRILRGFSLKAISNKDLYLYSSTTSPGFIFKPSFRNALKHVYFIVESRRDFGASRRTV